MGQQRTPLGFYVAAVCAAVFGAAMVRLALVPFWWGHLDVLVRAAALVLAGLSAVAAEALWRARPWAYRASLALAVAYACVLAIKGFLNDGMDGVVTAVWMLILSAIVVVPLVAYVRHRSEDLFGPTTPRRPRPVLAAAARGRWRPGP